MKISEMEKILYKEFPDIYVSFSIEIDKYHTNNLKRQIRLYSDKNNIGFIDGSDFLDCVRQLKERLNTRPNLAASVEFDSLDNS